MVPSRIACARIAVHTRTDRGRNSSASLRTAGGRNSRRPLRLGSRHGLRHVSAEGTGFDHSGDRAAAQACGLGMSSRYAHVVGTETAGCAERLKGSLSIGASVAETGRPLIRRNTAQPTRHGSPPPKERHFWHLVLNAVVIALSRLKQGFDSPRERHLIQWLSIVPTLSVQRMSNKRACTRVGGCARGWTQLDRCLESNPLRMCNQCKVRFDTMGLRRLSFPWFRSG